MFVKPEKYILCIRTSFSDDSAIHNDYFATLSEVCSLFISGKSYVSITKLIRTLIKISVMGTIYQSQRYTWLRKCLEVW